MKRARPPASPSARTEANVPVELAFASSRRRADPFNHLALDAVFVDPQGRELRVPGFWAGGAAWKVRYASPLAGRHAFRTECNDISDTGLHGLSGAVEIAPYSGANPLYRHGPLRVAAGRRHLEHGDGTPFFWLGDTWWMGLCHRLHWPDDFQKLAADRAAKGFNVVQIVAGLYPDMPAFDPRGANESGFPWEENYARIRPAYFDAADRRLRHLVELGITPCLVAAWGYFSPWMGVDRLKTHWRHLIARYGAWPMVWCIAGEANLPWYLDPTFPRANARQVSDWTQVTRYVRENDPFRRPITLHPMTRAREATEAPALLDFDFLQTGHGMNESVATALHAVRTSYAAADPVMPVINGEPCYEMLNDNLTAEWPRRAFWACMLNGAAGHTYGANGIWQCNRADQPHGASPWGHSYGKITWEEAMRLPGSAQVALGKNLLEQYPWQRFRPHPEWVAFDGLAWLPLAGCHWIWSDTSKPGPSASNFRRYFRRAFEIEAGRPLASVHLRFAGENHVEAQLNGRPAGVGWDRNLGAQFDDRARLLRPGPNVLTLWVEYRPPHAQNTGLIACLEIVYADGETLRIGTDASWKCADSEVAGWQEGDFDDRARPQAVVLGSYGDAPWGSLAEPDPILFGPQAAGIPGLVQIFYVPCALPITIRSLGERAAYRASLFDPVDGQRTEIGCVQSDARGEWRPSPPPGTDHDWVVILETSQRCKARPTSPSN